MRASNCTQCYHYTEHTDETRPYLEKYYYCALHDKAYRKDTKPESVSCWSFLSIEAGRARVYLKTLRETRELITNHHAEKRAIVWRDQWYRDHRTDAEEGL